MKAIKKIRKYIVGHPDTEAARTLVRLVVALESENDFRLQELYDLDHDVFEMARDMLKEWRLDRYYTAKGQLLDVAMQVLDES
ncbi:MAG: hypothetical protein IPK20_15600 [Betaproteobacteria bacterium]|nr:hypothetical protein [Betaproteobacteria bacterium]